ncbi:hypothetical protein KI387_017112, partial [Taxus chinensis]
MWPGWYRTLRTELAGYRMAEHLMRSHSRGETMRLPLGILSPLCTQSAGVARVLGMGVRLQRGLVGIEKPLGS